MSVWKVYSQLFGYLENYYVHYPPLRCTCSTINPLNPASSLVVRGLTMAVAGPFLHRVLRMHFHGGLRKTCDPSMGTSFPARLTIQSEAILARRFLVAYQLLRNTSSLRMLYGALAPAKVDQGCHADTKKLAVVLPVIVVRECCSVSANTRLDGTLKRT